MSVILPHLLNEGVSVVGLCTKTVAESRLARLKAWLSNMLGRTLGIGRETFVCRDPFAGLASPQAVAKKHGIRVFASKDLKSPSFRETLKDLNIDLVLVAGFHRKIPEGVYGLARRYAINLHPSLLPRHRGGTPSRWVVRAGENETGISAHALEADFDTGSLYCQMSIPLDGRRDCWGDVENKLLQDMPGFALDIIRAAEQETLNDAVAQDESMASYEPSMRGAEQQIDWNASAVEINRLCRSIRPKSGGLTAFGNTRLCLWETEPEDGNCADVAAGTITAVGQKCGIRIACGLGTTLIVHSFLQFGRPIPAVRVAQKLGLKPGDRLQVKAWK